MTYYSAEKSDLGLCPIALHRILQYDFKDLTEFCTVTHSTETNSTLPNTALDQILHRSSKAEKQILHISQSIETNPARLP
jgi:hypothetical protein